LNKAIEHADYVLNDIQKEYDEDIAENPVFDNKIKDHLTIDWLTVPENFSMNDVVYETVFGRKNATYESIFELQYDGSVNKTPTIGNYLSSYGSSLSTGPLVAGNILISSVSNYEAEKGFGKADNRLLSTIMYEPDNSTGAYPIIKNVARTINYNEREDMSLGAQYQYRESGSMDANWPVYRAADVMLIKAEAIARLHSGVTVANSDANSDGATNRIDVTNENQILLMQGYDLVNALFKRSNPTLKNPDEFPDAENSSERLSAAYPLGKSGATLLTLVYNERQREFVGEGKRWYDLVRQAEYDNSTSNVLTSHMAATTIVKNRLKQLYSMYNPIYAEEMKIAGVENGGALVQNPVWERYSK
jgi:hypothetical protein